MSKSLPAGRQPSVGSSLPNFPSGSLVEYQGHEKKKVPEISKSLPAGGQPSVGSSLPTFPSGSLAEYQGHEKK